MPQSEMPCTQLDPVALREVLKEGNQISSGEFNYRMTFVDAFYSFALDISDSNRNIYQSTRIKTPKHPNETHQLLIARLLAFVHSFKDSLKFSHGLFEIDQPTIWEKDTIGEITEWIQVGELPFKKLQRAVRRNHNATFKVYFYCPASAESEHFKNLLSYKSSGELRGGRYGEAKEKKTI